MGRWVSLFAGVALAWSSAAPATADDAPALLLQPSSAWLVNYADKRCRLSRSFGEGENHHLLYFETYAPTDNPFLTVAGPAIERLNPRKLPAIDFGEEWVARKGNLWWGELSGVGKSLQLYNSFAVDQEQEKNGSGDNDPEENRPHYLKQVDLDRAAKIERLSIMQGDARLDFETGEMSKAFAALNSCTLDLVRHWGIDVDRHQGYRTEAELLNENQVTRRVFRKALRHARQENSAAAFAITLIVEADGKVSNCIANEKTAINIDFEPLCRSIKWSARFKPAIDSQGNAMKSFYWLEFAYRRV